MTTNARLPQRTADGGSERLEVFSDSILAIAITLLVLDIHVPHLRGNESLAHGLFHLWPYYLAYALSFCTIGLIWVAHHSMFRRVGDVDRPLLLVNLALMACVAFLPFSTAVLAQFSWYNSHGADVAAALYSLNMLAIGVAFLGLWIYLSRNLHLFIGHMEAGALRGAIIRSAIVPGAYTLTFALAFWNTTACYVIWLATTVYIAFGPATRKIPVWTAAGPPQQTERH
jgi:uncharacterized membrane protein